MKLRSHEILSTNKKPLGSSSSSHPSRFKQLFQRKNIFKKKFQQQQSTHQHGLVHAIPDYVRKSIFRFLLEVKSSTPSSPPPPSSSPLRSIRQPPLMGIQALKKKHHQPKRSLRIQQQQTVIDNNHKTFEDYQQQQQQQNNYDMTILHMNIDDANDDDDDDNDLIFATKTSTNQKKPIPQWARKNELQIAICNQLYFHRNPSEIFGNTMDCSPAHLRTILHSMLPNVELLDDSLHQSPCNSNKSILI
ncbi:unnamed protein product [Rotaria sp. Silwood2]|nr:unnamed protein product [Rotaria sp. Silwood2]CAF2592086.1 unnamed protein product [Rotaria sp. Silwood2]CAF2976471.1 unnamed protein product [Rotaria sp. Silwood2]CAF3943222.1 unnamed protein product [Rotaria sp. Silwood2]CAF4154297.1 unnamed protein product [Rotaria sp. Silwood2]